MLKKVKLIRQETMTECALACISMVEHYYGLCQPISYYRNRLRIGRDGASFKDIHFLLASDNMSVQVLKVEDFDHFCFEKGPYIIHLSKAHFVVAERQKDGQVKIYDPSGGVYSTAKSKLQTVSSGYCIYATPSSEFTCSNNDKNDFRHLIPVIKKLSALIVSVILVSLLAYLITLLLPTLLQYYVNNIYYDRNFNSTAAIWQFIALAGLFWGISSLRNKAMTKLQLRLYRAISFSTIEHLFKVNYSYFDNRSEGDILYRLQFLTQFQNAISGTLLQLIMSTTSVAVVLAYFGVKYFLLLLIITPILILFFVAVIMMNNHLLKLKKDELQANSLVEQTVTEIVNNMLQIRCLHLEESFWGTYRSKFETFLGCFKISQSITQKYSLVVNILFTFMPPALVIVVMSIYRSEFEIGAIFAIFSLLTTLFNQCMSLVTNISSVQILKASIAYLNDFRDEPEQALPQDYTAEIFSTLEAKSVSFRYSDIGADTIKNINFKINCGEKIAIVGASGSGKTTIVKLIASLYNPTSGELLFNGFPIHKFDRNVYGKIISIVPQIPIVFNKSIRENIALNISSISDDDIIETLKFVCLWDEISTMPQGLDTIISGQGGNLSGGQIQRLSLARSLLRRPQLLILDESTSSLDSKNEQGIYNNLKRDGITSLIITHRLSTIENADRIYVLDKGKIVGAGTHKTLLKTCQQYYELYSAQATNRKGDIYEI